MLSQQPVGGKDQERSKDEECARELFKDRTTSCNESSTKDKSDDDSQQQHKLLLSLFNLQTAQNDYEYEDVIY